MDFMYYMPARIYFGAGKLNVLADIPLPGQKALLVLGGASMWKYGYVQRIQDMLEGRGISVVIFDKIQPNPIVEHVMEAAALARSEGCDFVIGLGGGSSMDSAKSIAVMATNEGHYWDYINGGSGKGIPVENRPLPIIAITTTAGTGTEADPWTVITKEDTQEKIGFGYDGTIPTISIVDPEIMTTVPPHLTAYQGFDAFFHASEGYIANIASEMSGMFSLKAISLIGKYLPTAIQDGKNIQARGGVALANTLAGFVETLSSCTSEHSLAHAMGGIYPEIPHGAALITISLSYFRFFADKCPDRFADMAKALEVSDFVEGLANLQKACNVDTLTMSQFGIKRERIPEIAKNAQYTMGGLFAWDRYSLSYDEILSILEDAYR